MKKLLLALLITLSHTSFAPVEPAYAWGQCIGQLQPMCVWPAYPICVDAGYSRQDYWICIR